LCKLYEGHTDALAIIQEVGAVRPPAGTRWGMWAAEPPQARVRVQPKGDSLQISGRKAWCSGAAVLSHALMTAWDEDGQQQMVAVDLRQSGVSITQEGWRAVGMGATGSVEVEFVGAHGIAIGKPGDYLSRPGFWQGGIGIAACWYGAAQAIAVRLLQHAAKSREPHAMAHLGAVDVAMHSAVSVLQDAARCIDLAPAADTEHLARRSRAVIEHSAEQVIFHVGRALGAGPYCKDPHFARLIADLPVFLRQSHAERDLAALGELTADQATQAPSRTWML
jgi:alkylation response protein AidB-like acyl-CoA dehydrogenase